MLSGKIRFSTFVLINQAGNNYFFRNPISSYKSLNQLTISIRKSIQHILGFQGCMFTLAKGKSTVAGRCYTNSWKSCMIHTL